MADGGLALIEGLTAGAVRMAIPLVLASQGEVLMERSGIINVGLEGIMLVGAFAGAAGAHATGSPWLGLLLGVAAGAGLAMAFGLLTVFRRTDQVVTGIALNLLALGLTGVLFHAASVRDIGTIEESTRNVSFQDVRVPLLASIPLLGSAFFDRNALAYLAYLVAPTLAYFLFRTQAGLRLRATGEDPSAAEAAGVRVLWVRFAAIIVGGALAASGGVYLSVGHLDHFGENMVAGRGFIALAIVILGRWNPWGTLAAALLFGLAQAVQMTLGATGSTLPYQVLLALPYLVALAALLFRFGAARPPAALARPYQRA